MAIASMPPGSLPPPRRKIVTYGKAKRTPLFRLHEEDSPSPKKSKSESSEREPTSVPASPSRHVSATKPQGPSTSVGHTASVFDIPPSDDEIHPPRAKAVGSSIQARPRNKAQPKKQPEVRARQPTKVRDTVTAIDTKNVFDIPSSDNEQQKRRKRKDKEAEKRRMQQPSAAGGTTSKKKSPSVATKDTGMSMGSDDSAITATLKRKSDEYTLDDIQKPTSPQSSSVKDAWDFSLKSEDDELMKKRKSTLLSTPRAPPTSNDPSRSAAQEHPHSDTTVMSRKRRKATPNRETAVPISTRPEMDTNSRAIDLKTKTKRGTVADGQMLTAQAELSNTSNRRPINKKKTPPDYSKKTRVEKTASTTAMSIPIRPGTSYTSGNGARPANLMEIEFETEYDLLPPNQAPESPRSASPMSIDGQGSVTPRQKRLWSNLLVEDGMTESPSQLELHNLNLKDRSAKGKASGDGRIDLTHNDGKRRLIDRLAQSQHTSASELSSDEETSSSSLHQRSESLEKETTSTRDAPPKLESQRSNPTKTLNGTGGMKVTYAKQRSHLEESMVDSADILGSMTMDSPILAKPAGSAWSQPTFSTTKDLSEFNIDDEELSDSGNAMKSIHELRAAGANRRFKNDVDALFEDLHQPQKASKSSRRSAMVNLATKMADKDFTARLLDNGLSQRIFNASVQSYGEDPILGFAFATVVGFILKAEKSSVVLVDIRESGTLRSLSNLLRYGDGIIRVSKERRVNMSRVAQNSMRDLHKLVQASALWTGTPPADISPRLLALRCLELSTRAMRKSGDREELLSHSRLSSILDIAQASSSNSLTGSVSPNDQRCVYYSLSIALDTMLGEAASDIWTRDNLHTFQSMVASFLDTPPRFGEKVEFLATKLCLNLTNSNADISELFATPDIVQSFLRSIERRFKLLSGPIDLIERTVTLDHLILGLGAMINLAEFSESARLAVISEDDVLLNATLRIYLDGRKRVFEAESIEESHGNVAYGYLTVLMANLCHSRSVRNKIRARLPQENLSSLINGLEEFISLQMITNKIDARNNEGQEIWSSYTERLRSMGDRLQQFEETER